MGLSKRGPKKLTQGKNSINHGNVDSINDLDFATCPTHLRSYSSDVKLPPLSQNFHFGAGVEGNGGSSGKMGDFSQRESHSYRRQNNRRHIERPNKHHGQVRGGSYGGMEEPFPTYRGECSLGVLANGGRSLDHHAKPILALPLGQAKISPLGKHSALAKREVILDAPL